MLSPQPAPQPAKSNRSVLTMLAWPVVAVLVIAGVYYWQHKKVNDLNSKLSSANSQLATTKAQTGAQLTSSLKDQVVGTVGSSVDLVSFLGSDSSTCSANKATPTGWYQVVKEVSDNFAKMQYGCISSGQTAPSGGAAYILADKASGSWKLISPTNQWVTVNNVEYPTCTMINDNKFTKQIEPKCAAATTTNGQSAYTVQDNANL